MSEYYTAEKIQERMSISTLVFQGYRPFGEEALQELVDEGIRRIEIVESPDQYDLSDIRAMRFIDETCRRVGVEVVAYHAYMTTFEGIETEAQRLERVDVCRRQIDTMLELGGTAIHARMLDATCSSARAIHRLLHAHIGRPRRVQQQRHHQSGARRREHHALESGQRRGRGRAPGHHGRRRVVQPEPEGRDCIEQC